MRARALALGLAPGLVFCLVFCLFFWGCSLFVDTSGLDTGPDASGDAGPDARRDAPADGSRQDRTVDSPSKDAKNDAIAPDTTPPDVEVPDTPAEGPVVTGDAGLVCPSKGGPVMVAVNGMFCIDSTEVTNSEYADFLASSPSIAGQIPVCSFNTTFVPPGGWPYTAGQGDYPVGYVNWCDAYAFCLWSDKRMCGAIGGGSFAMSDYANPSVDQRFYACSQAASLIYPYGDTYNATTCNGSGSGTGAAAKVGSFSGCVGGFAGLYDMVGNVEEWQDSCSGMAGATDTCLDGAGAFDYPPDAGATGTRCDFLDTDSRGAHYPDLGIRCCAP